MGEGLGVGGWGVRESLGLGQPAPLPPCDGARWPGASPSDGAATHSFAWWVSLAGFLHWGWEVREGARERRYVRRGASPVWPAPHKPTVASQWGPERPCPFTPGSQGPEAGPGSLPVATLAQALFQN